jgi:sterol desaturase/sphingolipid hydroxylase (fatty acid hydroxylase superfamily)
MPYAHAQLGRWSERASYYLDFTLYPAAAIGAAALTCRSMAWVAGLLFGLLLFTFAEYWTHRLVLHRLFYHETHMHHHAHPRDYVVFPVLYIPLAFVLVFAIMPTSIAAGSALGWFWFCVAHHAMHHWDFAWVRAISRWHDIHHKSIRSNFGITHPLFDVLFGTYRRIK